MARLRPHRLRKRTGVYSHQPEAVAAGSSTSHFFSRTSFCVPPVASSVQKKPMRKPVSMTSRPRQEPASESMVHTGRPGQAAGFLRSPQLDREAHSSPKLTPKLMAMFSTS